MQHQVRGRDQRSAFKGLSVELHDQPNSIREQRVAMSFMFVLVIMGVIMGVASEGWRLCHRLHTPKKFLAQVASPLEPCAVQGSAHASRLTPLPYTPLPRGVVVVMHVVEAWWSAVAVGGRAHQCL